MPISVKNQHKHPLTGIKLINNLINISVVVILMVLKVSQAVDYDLLQYCSQPIASSTFYLLELLT